MFSSKFTQAFVGAWLLFGLYAIPVCGMGANAQEGENGGKGADGIFAASPKSDATLKQLADIYWPDSNATEVQREETLKNLLGKRVTWEITIAEIQRQSGDIYLIQGGSDEKTIGTFSYVKARDEAEKMKILAASRGDTLKITGIVSDMQVRHIVLDPARLD